MGNSGRITTATDAAQLSHRSLSAIVKLCQSGKLEGKLARLEGGSGRKQWLISYDSLDTLRDTIQTEIPKGGFKRRMSKATHKPNGKYVPQAHRAKKGARNVALGIQLSMQFHALPHANKEALLALSNLPVDTLELLRELAGVK